MKTILMPLPNNDYDPSEAGVSFYTLKKNHFDVVFATPKGSVATADQLMATGKKLGLLKNSLMADKNALIAYHEMINDHNYLHPISYEQINPDNFDGIVLSGGHDKGMREYLESQVLQSKILKFYQAHKPIGAICHGPILLARTKDDQNQSIIYHKKITALNETQEHLAYHLTKFFLDDYYLTYPESVESEMKRNLANPAQFINGPGTQNYFSVSMMKRDSADFLERGFAIRDGNIVTARWPGDVHRFIEEFISLFK
jgi:protease I